MRSSHPCSRSLSRPRGIPPRARSILDIYLGTSELLSYYLAVHLIIYIYIYIYIRVSWIVDSLKSRSHRVFSMMEIYWTALFLLRNSSYLYIDPAVLHAPIYIIACNELLNRTCIPCWNWMEWNFILFTREGGKEGRKDDRRRFWTAWKLI